MERQPYIYGSAAPAVAPKSYPREAPSRGGFAYPDSYPEKNRANTRAPKPRIDVIQGGGDPHARSSAHAFAITVAKAAVVLIAIFLFIGFVRVSLASATVTEAMEAKEVRNNLSEVRSSINDMQVEQSTLSNPTRIKDEAEALGMSSPEITHVIDISGDIVATESSGALSLTGSLEALSASASDNKSSTSEDTSSEQQGFSGNQL